jgi:transcription elongation factor GreA
MTPRGKVMLDEELKRLKGSDRPPIVTEIEISRAQCVIWLIDSSQAATERQGQIEARIRLLEDRLARAQVIDGRGQGTEKVSFGATVVLSDVASGDEVTYTIVGEDEADIASGLISVTSPVARALLGKERDASVRVQVPKGTREFEILEIRFELLVETSAS